MAVAGSYSGPDGGALAHNSPTITNSGNITAEIAILAFNNATTANAEPGVNLTNSGAISGALMLGSGYQAIHNTGVITGNI